MHRSSLWSLVATDRSRRLGARTRPWLERLEDRLVLSANWVSEGPAPTTHGEVSGMLLQLNPVTGAINTFALDPNNPNIAFVGAVSGGIWRTMDAQSLAPSWTPLTDSMPSLSIGDIAFSSLEPSTLYAGTGSFSNGNNADAPNGAPTAVSPSVFTKPPTWATPGRATTPLWTLPVGRPRPSRRMGLKSDPSCRPARSGRPARRSCSPGSWATTATAAYTRVSTPARLGSLCPARRPAACPAATCLSIVADPANPGTFYAGVPGSKSSSSTDAGIYKSTDGGSTWNALSLPDTPTIPMSKEVQEADDIKLAVHTDPSNDVLYALIGTTTVANAKRVSYESVYSSAIGGSTVNWIQMGDNFDGATSQNFPQLNADNQTDTNLTIAASENLPNRVFVAGTGGIWEGDLDIYTRDTTWTAASGAGAGGNPSGSPPQPTSPHSDSRTMRFDALGNLWESDDGGVYRLVNPDMLPTQSDQTSRYWVSANGDLQVAEFYSAAWDSQTNTVFAGAQDNGADLQLSEASATWLMTFFADSKVVAVDNTSLAAQGETRIYAVAPCVPDPDAPDPAVLASAAASPTVPWPD